MKNRWLILLPIITLMAFAMIPIEKPSKRLIIVTTTEIRQASQQLPLFIQEKEKRGFSVLLATEEQFGGQGVFGQEKALLIRQWLKTVAADSDFLLLIGDPHPKYGDIPMLTVWPRHTYPEDECLGFAVNCQSEETDLFYSNLTGNWDLNENGRYGEHGLDDGEGGIDFSPQLIVGRIPVYFHYIDELDPILSKTIWYMNQKEAEIAYRQKILLPAAFFYFKGQKMTSYTVNKNVDGAVTPEWFIYNVLTGHPDVAFTRLYEKEGVVVSAYDTDTPLTEENLVAEWSKGYGMVFWFGHGFYREVARTIWTADKNGDGKADPDEIANPGLISFADAPDLPVTQPAFVLADSCEVGSAEVPYNLSYNLLRYGGAIGIIASSSMTPGSLTNWEDLSSEVDETEFGGDSLGVYVFAGLIQGEYPAQVLAELKETLGTSNSIEAYAAKMMLNYFGDPSLTLYDTENDIIAPPDPEEPKGSKGCQLMF